MLSGPATMKKRFPGTIPARLATGAPLGLLLLMLGLLTGCLSRPPVVPQSFNFAIPSLRSSPTEAGRHVLEIRQLRVAAPFDSQSFVYRTGPSAYERDPYAQFLVRPEESFVAPLRGYFLNSGLFQDVSNRGSALQPDTMVEIYVSELYGDFRNKAAPAAVLSMRFVFFEVKQGAPGAVILQKEYAERVGFKTRTAAALMAGWNEAFQRITEAVITDLKAGTKDNPHG